MCLRKPRRQVNYITPRCRAEFQDAGAVRLRRLEPIKRFPAPAKCADWVKAKGMEG